MHSHDTAPSLRLLYRSGKALSVTGLLLLAGTVQLLSAATVHVDASSPQQVILGIGDNLPASGTTLTSSDHDADDRATHLATLTHARIRLPLSAWAPAAPTGSP